MSDHNLIYICKETGKEFKGKTIVPNELVSILDPETGEKVTVTKNTLTRKFKGCRGNRKVNKYIPLYSGVKRGREKKNVEPTWEDYLNGVG